jgi:hypothetical protein
VIDVFTEAKLWAKESASAKMLAFDFLQGTTLIIWQVDSEYWPVEEVQTSNYEPGILVHFVLQQQNTWDEVTD